MPDDDRLRLGGMALRNGLLVHGPEHWAAAVRTADGAIATASGPKPRFTKLDGIPGARGVARLAEAMAVIPLVKRRLPEAQLPFQQASVAAAAAGATVATALLRRRARGSLGAEAGAAALSVLPSLVALRGGELAAYHGAEHKTIGAYEDGTDDHAKEHDRCGSHLMAPLIASNLAGVALLKGVMEKPTPLAAGAVAVASVGVAVEVFAWSERHAETAAARALRKPGHELQRVIGTREPTAAQLEVGRAALDEILRAEGAA
ncbi:MAG TPA: DUF1385 domain-containing protein [Solirubrobacteraceae bacterium]|nr:DUF1385 domain-containing protein [Solirubrobacteraceae bacterium]